MRSSYFATLGVPGRTGHDYPNRWIDDALDWFGKGISQQGQPMIDAMIGGAMRTHVFWRGRDRAPFTYAGVGRVEGVWGERPVEVLWRFDDVPPAPTTRSSPSVRRGADPVAVFRHGPPPSFGFRQMLVEDGECLLYLMVLEGAVDALFPELAPSASGRSLIKVGISRDPARRQRELNSGFPKGAAAGWRTHTSRTFASVKAAYHAEGALLESLAASGRWISGEFAIVAQSDLEELLHGR